MSRLSLDKDSFVTKLQIVANTNLYFQWTSRIKKLLTIICLFYTTLAASLTNDAASVLQRRLNQINSFYASFTQSVVNTSGVTIQEGDGELWLKRPNLFYWHMFAPDESLLVSDGKTLWFYNPFVEQVTANWLKDVTDNTPFILVARNNTADWDNYNIKQQGNRFSLVPKVRNDSLKQFMINVNTDGIIISFTILEQDGQSCIFQLKKQKKDLVNDNKFYFIVPRNVSLDDQRQ